ncbi:hypothetical protein CRE_10697 [Caenorhabditis remanei]|uniref:Uncharacterized protein n=1 Tax=Caenorhabditis remanei TaxID=31234 RepID=E3NL69_CAERE|nr:hypothetical protein CRE_10697 [Caenorhabditis remanei]
MFLFFLIFLSLPISGHTNSNNNTLDPVCQKEFIKFEMCIKEQSLLPSTTNSSDNGSDFGESYRRELQQEIDCGKPMNCYYMQLYMTQLNQAQLYMNYYIEHLESCVVMDVTMTIRSRCELQTPKTNKDETKEEYYDRFAIDEKCAIKLLLEWSTCEMKDASHFLHYHRLLYSYYKFQERYRNELKPYFFKSVIPFK